jgi:hypothetical protein
MRSHGLDPSSVSKEDAWRAYKRGDRASELVELHLKLAHQEQEMDRACRRR